MELLKLNVKKRLPEDGVSVKELRRNNIIPAVMYGPGNDAVSLSVEKGEIDKLIKNGGIFKAVINVIIDSDEEKIKVVMIKEIQTQPLSRDILHIDFYEVNLENKIRVKIPVEVTGKSVGVEIGGMLQIIRRELEIMCLPMNIPESVILDVTDLDIGDSIHVNDISLPEEVEVIADVNFTLITVLISKEEEEEVEGEEVEEGEEGAEDDAESEEGASEEQKKKKDASD